MVAQAGGCAQRVPALLKALRPDTKRSAQDRRAGLVGKSDVEEVDPLDVWQTKSDKQLQDERSADGKEAHKDDKDGRNPHVGKSAYSGCVPRLDRDRFWREVAPE